jgi:hypothetical protein
MTSDRPQDRHGYRRGMDCCTARLCGVVPDRLEFVLSAVLEIEEAILTLNQLRELAPGAPWDYIDDRDGYEIQGSDNAGNELANSFARSDNAYASDLIVILHRTIATQIGILRAGVGGASDLDAGATPDEPHLTGYAVALARSINGTPQ